MKRIQFGWAVPRGPYNQLARDPFLADLDKGFKLIEGHFDSAWLTDHMQFEDEPLFEAWVSLSYLSALYPNFDFGHAVLSQSYRNPGLLAKMASTQQYLSNGRFILGLGAGWKEDEYTAYGYDFPSPGRRVDELEESLQIIKALWQDERASVQGKYYRVNAAYNEPKPQPRPTIILGGSKPRILRVVARHADWWNVSDTGIEDYRAKARECEKACADVGRDPATLRRTWFGSCLCAPTEEKVKALNSENLSSANAFIGTPAQVLEQLRPFIDMGVDYFMFKGEGFPDLTTLETLVNEVIPALNHA